MPLQHITSLTDHVATADGDREKAKKKMSETRATELAVECVSMRAALFLFNGLLVTVLAQLRARSQ